MRCTVIMSQRPCTSVLSVLFCCVSILSVGFLDQVHEWSALSCCYEPMFPYVSPQCWFSCPFISGMCCVIITHQLPCVSVLSVGFCCPFISGKYCSVIIHQWPRCRSSLLASLCSHKWNAFCCRYVLPTLPISPQCWLPHPVISGMHFAVIMYQQLCVSVLTVGFLVQFPACQ